MRALSTAWVVFILSVCVWVQAGEQFLNLEYVAGGHERQKLDLYMPAPGAQPPALVAYVHGGAWRAGSKDKPVALFLLKQGFAVASLNYRLSQHAIFPAQIQDCKAAIRWLKANAKQYGYDPNRIGVWGPSAGGHLVALMGTSNGIAEFDVGANLEFSSGVQCVVDYFGPTDLLVMGKHSGPNSKLDHDSANSPESKLVGGPIQERKELAGKANPITYVSVERAPKIPPFLIVHGDDDPVVPIGQSTLLHDALKKAGVDSTFHPIKGAKHGGQEFSNPEIQKMISAFFEKHLSNK